VPGAAPFNSIAKDPRGLLLCKLLGTKLLQVRMPGLAPGATTAELEFMLMVPTVPEPCSLAEF